MKKLLNKKVLVFDFDGTVVDSMTTFAKIASKVMPKYYKINTEKAYELYMSTSGIPFFEQLETIFPNHPSNADAAKEFETLKKESYFSEKVFEDAHETMRTLRKNNIKVVISSNNFQELVDSFVNKSGLEFDMVLGFRKNFSKGEDHFNHIIKNLGCTRNEITFVGDSIKDAEKSANCKIDFIGKEGIFSRDDFKKNSPSATVISSLSELKEMF